MPSREVRRLTAVQMDVVATTKRSVAIVLGVVVLLMLVLLAWIGGEAHYRGCIAHAEAQYPVVAAQAAPPTDQAAREDAIDGCSRLP